MKLFLKRHWKTIVIFAALLVLFLLNAFHEKYPDEFDSLLGGRYIDMGLLQYRDWFQHHQPGAYVVAAILLPFTGLSFVRLRVAWAAVIFGINVLGYWILRRRFPKKNLTFYLIFMFTVALAGTYFWWQMLLADSLAAYCIIPAFALLFMKDYYRSKVETIDLIIISGFAFLTWYASMTYIYIVAVMSAYAFFLYLSGRSKSERFWPAALRGAGIVGAPYIIFVLWLVATGSVKDYYFASVVYNDYYIYNFPHHIPGTMINPIRYAVVILNNFINNYLLALGGVTGFPLTNPAQVTFALSSFAALILVIITGRFPFLIPLLVMLVYSNARSNPQSIRQTDYQSAVYVMTSMFSGLFTISALKELIDEKRLKLSGLLVAGSLMLLLVLYWIFTPVYFGQKMFQKYYDKYMGTAPLIYDRPQVANYVNAIINPGDEAWVGPFAFEELFYLHINTIPSKYHWFLQWAPATKIAPGLIADMTKNRPKVIVFQRNYAPWGGDASQFNGFFQKFLDTYYFRIFTLNATLKTVQYKWTIGNTQNYDIDGDFNFDKRYEKQIIEKLLSLGYIKAVPKTK